MSDYGHVKSEDGLSKGKRIRKLREAAELNQTELAEKVGVGQQAIQKIEADMVARPTCLYQIAQALGARMEYIISGSMPMYIRDLKPVEVVSQTGSSVALTAILSSIAIAADKKEITHADLEFITTFVKKITNCN